MPRRRASSPARTKGLYPIRREGPCCVRRSLPSRIASIFVKILVAEGWPSPPPAHHLEKNVAILKTLTQTQPEASQTPAFIPEFHACVVVRSSTCLQAPCAVLHRLDHAWELPPDALRRIRAIPQHAELLGHVPLRLKGGTSEMAKVQR